jgi:hypothetical protein
MHRVEEPINLLSWQTTIIIWYKKEENKQTQMTKKLGTHNKHIIHLGSATNQQL